MPKLLMVTTIGGTFSFLVPFARHFRGLGWTVDALTGPIGDDPELKAFDRVFQVPWSRNPLDPRNLAVATRRVRRVVDDGRYELVHVHTPVASFATRFALRGRGPAGPKVVYTAHGFAFHPAGKRWPNLAFETLERLAARWTDSLVVMNREDAEAASRWGVLPGERIWWMPGIGVDLRGYGPGAVSAEAVRAVRAELGVGDAPWFLAIAEFIPRKRHADLLRAFGRLAARPELPPASLVLGGIGPLEPRMRALAETLGIASRVRFVGRRRDVPALLAAATALVLPSQQEGLPRCVLEAMAMGLPVIGSRIRGTTELLECGAGFLYELGDVAALAGLLERVLLDPAAASAAARRARERIAAYAEEKVVALHEALYAQALASATAPAPAPAPGAEPGRPALRSA
ncbi:MAG TPA: glycosyltransferase [Anaeromyxobacteraceae bacterium]|nr:glycosyltransferase [Anaeromyxobacteraceae bacterium]